MQAEDVVQAADMLMHLESIELHEPREWEALEPLLHSAAAELRRRLQEYHAAEAHETKETAIAEASPELREAFAAESDRVPLTPPGTVVPNVLALLIVQRAQALSQWRVDQNNAGQWLMVDRADLRDAVEQECAALWPLASAEVTPERKGRDYFTEIELLRAQVERLQKALRSLAYSDGHFKGACSRERCHPICIAANAALSTPIPPDGDALGSITSDTHPR